MFKNKKGFTLIELLIVIAIIGVLSSVVLANINSSRSRARDVKRVQDLAQIRTALELYLDANGHYPPSDCGWDCNGYRYSYDTNSWNALATELAPYIATLPKDPLNAGCAPWGSNGCYSYAYGNVGRTVYGNYYDLTAQLETQNHPLSCGLKNYKYWMSGTSNWCTAFGGSYNNNIYEASIQ